MVGPTQGAPRLGPGLALPRPPPGTISKIIKTTHLSYPFLFIIKIIVQKFSLHKYRFNHQKLYNTLFYTHAHARGPAELALAPDLALVGQEELPPAQELELVLGRALEAQGVGQVPEVAPQLKSHL